MEIPLIADITKQISTDYGVLIEEGEDAGVSLRYASIAKLIAIWH